MSSLLYHHIFSSPSRSALLTIRNLGLNVQVKIVDIFNGEQHSPKYLKINPLNQIPAFVDGDFVLTESKAIATYLANSNKSLLYPSDYKKRALIDSKLYFDSTSIFPVIRDFYVSFGWFKLQSWDCKQLFSDQLFELVPRKLISKSEMTSRTCWRSWTCCWKNRNGLQAKNFLLLILRCWRMLEQSKYVWSCWKSLDWTLGLKPQKTKVTNGVLRF